MKNLTEYYGKKDILFKEIKEILPKDLSSRKKIVIYIATSIKSYYYAIFIVDSKSRFIKKHAQELCDLCDKLILYSGHNFKQKEVLIKSPLCSKAKEFLKTEGFKVRIDFK